MNKNIIVTAIVALVVSLAVVFIVPHKTVITNESDLGGLSERDVSAVTLKVGPLGHRFTKVLSGRVNCAAGTATLITGGQNTYDCNVVGVRSGDTIVVSLGNPKTGLAVGGAYASTTANNYFTLALQSATTTSVAVGTATTSVSYVVTRQ